MSLLDDKAKSEKDAYLEAVRQRAYKNIDESALLGKGPFRDTGRQSSGWGEAYDSLVGAPARVGIDEMAKTIANQKPQDAFDFSDYGRGAVNAIKKTISQIGADPRGAPSGYDVASKYTDNPYLGTAMSTAVDMAQLPGGGLLRPGLLGEVRGVKSAGKIADASEAFAERGAKPPSTEAKIAQMYGETGDVKDATKSLIDRAGKEYQTASRKGISMAELNEGNQEYGTSTQRSAYDNPKNAPPKSVDLDKSPSDYAREEWENSKDEKPQRDVVGNVIEAPEFQGAKQKGTIVEKMARKRDSSRLGSWESDYPNLDEDQVGHLSAMDARGVPDAKIRAAQNPESHHPYSDVGHDHPLPNFEATPNGTIGSPGISSPFGDGNREAFPWMDDKYKASKQLLLRQKSIGEPAQIHTSSDLIAKYGYIDSIPRGSTVNIYKMTPDDTLNRIIYPSNPSNNRLDRAAQALKERGIKTNVIEPTIEDAIKAAGGPEKIQRQTGIAPNELEDAFRKRGMISDAEKAADAASGVTRLPGRRPDSLEAQTPTPGGLPANIAPAAQANSLFAPPSEEEKQGAQGAAKQGATVQASAKPGDLFAPPSEEERSSYLDQPYGPGLMNAGTVFGAKNPREAIKKGLGYLPAAGMMVGGAAGEMLGGPGVAARLGVSFAGIGALGKNAGEKYILGEDTPAIKDVGAEAGKAGLYELGGQAMSAGGKAVLESPPGKWATRQLGDIGARVGNALTGIPTQEIKTYTKNVDEVNKMASATDYNPLFLANNARDKINSKIKETKDGLNQIITDALETRSGKAGQTIDGEPIIAALNKAGLKINPRVNPEDLEEVNGLIDQVRSLQDDKGQILLKDAYDQAKKFRKMGQGSYVKSGQIFQTGDQAAQTAKAGAAAMRESINEAAPEIAGAHEKFSELHDIEDLMNANMLKEGATPSTLMAAGAGQNPAQEDVLKRIGALTKFDALGEAQKAVAARQFGKPQLLPVDSTGKAALRAGAAGLLGSVGGPIPAVLATAATSPLTLKAAINAGNVGRKVIANPVGRGIITTGLLRASPLLRGKSDNENQIAH